MTDQAALWRIYPGGLPEHRFCRNCGSPLRVHKVVRGGDAWGYDSATGKARAPYAVRLGCSRVLDIIARYNARHDAWPWWRRLLDSGLSSGYARHLRWWEEPRTSDHEYYSVLGFDGYEWNMEWYEAEPAEKPPSRERPHYIMPEHSLPKELLGVAG